MKLRALTDLKDLAGRRALVRADFNVPVAKGKVGPDEDWRLRAVVPTVEWLSKRGAKVVLMAHLGRPEGRKDVALKTAPIAKRLAQLLRRPVKAVGDCVGPAATRAVKAMKDGDVILLENLRFHRGEEENDRDFAAKLAKHGDFYVNEAFATSHRPAASMVGVAKMLPAYAGPLLVSEVGALQKVLRHAKRPFVVLMGGGKVSSKIGVIERMLAVADRVLLGGALPAPFFEAAGFCVGATPCDEEDVRVARKLMRSRAFSRLILPHDLLIGDPKRPSATPRVIDLKTEPFDLCDHPKKAIVDIGPKTISAYASYLRSAVMMVWNGPMGLFEFPRFAHGTLALGRLFAARSKGRAFGLAGGGETTIALRRTGLMDCVDHVSTGGGAMLEFLEGKKLPGLLPLIK